MPTYDYECTKCGHRFEMVQPITEAAKKRVKNAIKGCDCDAPVTRCVGTGAGVIFKGSGFYQTDYRSEGYKKDAKADKESSEGKKDTGDGKKNAGDTKTAKDDKSSMTAAASDSKSTTKSETASAPAKKESSRESNKRESKKPRGGAKGEE